MSRRWYQGTCPTWLRDFTRRLRALGQTCVGAIMRVASALRGETSGGEKSGFIRCRDQLQHTIAILAARSRTFSSLVEEEVKISCQCQSLRTLMSWLEGNIASLCPRGVILPKTHLRVTPIKVLHDLKRPLWNLWQLLKDQPLRTISYQLNPDPLDADALHSVTEHTMLHHLSQEDNICPAQRKTRSTTSAESGLQKKVLPA